MDEFRIGDLVSLDGRTFRVRGFEPMSLPEQTVELADAATGARTRLPLARLATAKLIRTGLGELAMAATNTTWPRRRASLLVVLIEGESMKARSPSRPRWQVRTPRGAVLTVEFDPFRSRWRVTPGGYESRSLPRALAQASGSSEDAGGSRRLCAARARGLQRRAGDGVFSACWRAGVRVSRCRASRVFFFRCRSLRQRVSDFEPRPMSASRESPSRQRR